MQCGLHVVAGGSANPTLPRMEHAIGSWGRISELICCTWLTQRIVLCDDLV